MFVNTAALASSIDSRDTFLGHPKGVFVCFFTEMWERFSFYGMKALLLLFLIEHHKFGDKIGYDIIGAYGGLVYCIPVFGGLLADRYLGMRKAVIFGGILLVLGHAGMAIEGAPAYKDGANIMRDENALLVFYFSLSLIIMGVGFLKPNISTIVGKLYPESDPRRDSGFSLFYAGINLGALFASIVCGYLGKALGWQYGFGAAGIGMLLGLMMFLWGQKYLHGHAEPLQPQRLKEKTAIGINREWSIYLGALLGLLPLAGLMWAVANQAFSVGEHISLALMLMILVMMVVMGWFLWFILSQCERIERHRMISLMSLIFMCLIFFTLYEQTYGSWVTFTDRLLTKDLFPGFVRPEANIVWGKSFSENLAIFFQHSPWSIISLLIAPLSFMLAASWSDKAQTQSNAPKFIFLGACALILVLLIRDLFILPQNASSLTFLGAMFIVLLAPIFTGLWAWLDKFNADPSKPIKSSLGLLFAGLSFIPLALAAQQVGTTGVMASVWWLVLAYFILEIGEMCLSPVGLSAVTQLSVPRVVSLMMGTWFLATAFSEILASLFGKLAAIEVPEGETMSMIDAAAKYESLFWLMVAIGVGCSVVALIASPIIKRGMHGIK